MKRKRCGMCGEPFAVVAGEPYCWCRGHVPFRFAGKRAFQLFMRSPVDILVLPRRIRMAYLNIGVRCVRDIWKAWHCTSKDAELCGQQVYLVWRAVKSYRPTTVQA